MTIRQTLEKLVEKCNRCEGGDCINCGQKPLNIEEALTSIASEIEKAEQKSVADNLTYGDTKYNSNAVRFGYNQAITEVVRKVKGGE